MSEPEKIEVKTTGRFVCQTPAPSSSPASLSRASEVDNRLCREADHATGYLVGYDDAVNDCLRWLRQTEPVLMRQLVRSIQANSRQSQKPIKVAAEFLATVEEPK